MSSIHVRKAPPIREANDPGNSSPEMLRTATGLHARVTIACAKRPHHHAMRKRPQSHPTQENSALKVAAKVPVKAVVAVEVENQ